MDPSASSVAHASRHYPGQRFPRAAGIALPLFSLRGAHDVGSGEILDLVPFIDWLERWHQRVLQLLPINETALGEASPYNVLSVFALDPAYISATEVADSEPSAAAREWLRSSAVHREIELRRRSGHRDRRAVYELKLQLLQFGFDALQARTAADDRRRAFDEFCRASAWWLDDYALFRALKERERWQSWEVWPEDLRHRDTDALQRATAALRPRIRFFQYLQWVAMEQWQRVRRHARRRGVLLTGDLPFVCGRDSADVWAHPELFDPSSSAGTPPDAFSETGQAWGLPLYNWDAMRRSGFAWWRRRARHARELYDLFRVDHVVGLYRTYAIPTRAGGTSGFVPTDENEQLQQGRGLLDAVLSETGDTGVVAEDLGSVPDWVRASLTALRIPGYKVFRWETRDGDYIDPRTYPELSVTTTGTHDTDALKTWWEGLDLPQREAVLRLLDHTSALRTYDSALRWTDDLHLALLHRLYEAGSLLTILPFQDLFGWSDRINTPATVGAGNWTYRLPVEITRLDEIPQVRARMEAIRVMIDQTARCSRNSRNGGA
jgi:4-alpha-glucanotransferase